MENDKHNLKRITLGRIFKWFCISVIIFIYSCIVIRSFVSCDVGLAETVIYNDNTIKAYENEEEIYVEKYPISEWSSEMSSGQHTPILQNCPGARRS